MAKIEDSIAYILQNEGGWTIDDGGWTMYGIVVDDVAAYRKVSPHSITEQEMKSLTVTEATAIYKQQYWDKMSLDQVNAQNVATAIMDIGVNRGVSIGAKYAQKVVGVTADGAIGPISLSAINACNPNSFIKQIESLDYAGYQAILAENPSDQIYAAGWDARAKRLLTLLD